jgi:membrane protein
LEIYPRGNTVVSRDLERGETEIKQARERGRRGWFTRVRQLRAVRVLVCAITDFDDDDCPTQAAALAYYTLFSLPPLLVVVLNLAGALVDPGEIEGRIHGQFRELVGSAGADQLRDMLRAAQNSARTDSLIPTLIGIVVLFFGATGAFTQLQTALNRTWEVKADPRRNGFTLLLTRRVLSFAMILGMAFLMLVSLLVSALLAAFGDALGAMLPAPLGPAALRALDIGVGLAGLMLVLTLIFKFVPDARVAWREAAFGGAVTALLFALGKLLIGVYLGNSDLTTTYGAAGALAVILVWIYYSAMILLLGAELTQAWAATSGRRIHAAPGAVRDTAHSSAGAGDGAGPRSVSPPGPA